jgi:hypothetical protein
MEDKLQFSVEFMSHVPESSAGTARDYYHIKVGSQILTNFAQPPGYEDQANIVYALNEAARRGAALARLEIRMAMGLTK